MESKLVHQTFQVKGMTCPSCELKIENSLKKIGGVREVKAALASSAVEVHYDAAQVEPEKLMAAIAKLGYNATVKPDGGKDTKKFSINQLLGVGIIIFASYWIIKSTIGFNFIPQVDESVGYGMLFVIGLLTSLHCIAMCGGINISQCIKAPPSRINISEGAHPTANTFKPEDFKPEKNESKFAKFKPSFLYNSGRVISYTVIGGMVGALGSAISFSGAAKGLVAIIGGIFMVIIGINMLDIFPWLRKLKISTPKFFGNKIYSNAGKHGPFYIGLLNGLMPCGPLQTMQLYALGTGSFLAGAAAMFLFSLGTVPLMFGFGALSSVLSGKFTQRMLKVSAVLVIVLGFTMVGRGLSLSGVSLASPLAGNPGSLARIEGGVQTVTTTMESGRYQPFVVQKGIPVRWTIKAKAEDLNGCNNPVTIPKYNIQKTLVPGDNIIEFIPAEEGNITYTCWMGMIRSNIKVVSDVSRVTREDLNQINTDNGNINPQGGGGCCSAGSKAIKFYGGRIPTDDIQVASIAGGIQEVTITVNDEGYSPAAVILQRGIKAKIKFNPAKLNSCNYVVTFPEYRGQLDLGQGQTETPALDVTQDFTFQCWMGMLNGYVKVVDNINNIDMSAIKQEIAAYRPAGGGGCCGRR
jgi:sulfite exporter TauE/SafE/copper chaperone CopZ